MSLIFEALKKLERDKRAPERGFAVVTESAWPAPRASRLPLALGAIGLLGLGLLLGRWMLVPRAAAPLPEPAGATPRATAPSPTVAARAVPDHEYPAPALPAGTVAPSEAPAGEDPARHEFGPNTDAVAPPATAAPTEAAAAPPPTTLTLESAASRVATPPVTLESAASSAALTLTLEAVAQRDGAPVALIDGQLVREGDTIGGAVVVRIRPDAVELDVDGERRVLTF